MVTMLVASALQAIDFDARADPARAAQMFDDAVTMAAAALVACGGGESGGKAHRFAKPVQHV